MNIKEREIRHLSGHIQLRSDDNPDSRLIEGYALLFNKESKNLGYFTEVIRSSALTQTMINKFDVVALFNHDSNRGILARSTDGYGSLTLSVDGTGLKYSFEAPKTALGDEMLELLRRGDLRESSFAFTCSSDTWEKIDDNNYKRYINEIDAIYDVSIVVNPAYSGTAVKCRSFDQLKESETKELRDYYENLKSNI